MRPKLVAGVDRPGGAFSLAGQRISISPSGPELEAFRSGLENPRKAASHTADFDRRQEPTTRFQGLICGRQRQIECYATSSGMLITISDLGTFEIDTDHQDIRLVRQDPDVQIGQVTEAMLGPPLILSLASKGIFCLHAGAVTTDSGIVVFLGRSGNGKSTLAEAAGRHVDGWRRCADDMLPVSLHEDQVVVLPGFPQPKLSAALQWPLTAPTRLPLLAVYVIADLEPTHTTITIETLRRREALHSLLQHSVAWPLFWGEPADKHLELCSNIASKVSVRRLRYPRSIDELPLLAQTIRNDLESHSASSPL